MTEKGHVRNVKIAAQIFDHSKLIYFNNIYPTDIDAIYEFRNTVFIVIEFKYKQTEVKRGQRDCLERLVDTLYEGGLYSEEKRGKRKYAYLLFASYDEKNYITRDDGEVEIDSSSAIVFESRARGKSTKHKNGLTLKRAIDIIVSNHACEMESYYDKNVIAA